MKALTKSLLTCCLITIGQCSFADDCIRPKVKNAEWVGCVTEGLAGVVFKKSDRKYIGGYVDKNGKTVIPFIYTPHLAGEGGEFVEMNDFSEGLAAVQKISKGKSVDIDSDGYYGFIDKTGKTVIPFNYAWAESFSQGLAAVRNNEGKMGYINKEGKLAIPYRYSSASPFSDGLASVRDYDESGENGIKTVYIDKTGKIALTVNYEARDFSNGLARVIKDDKYGFMDKTGKIVIPMNFQYYEEGEEANNLDFVNGKALIVNGNQSFCINTQGKKVSCK